MDKPEFTYINIKNIKGRLKPHFRIFRRPLSSSRMAQSHLPFKT
ncbi:hypothetical protein MCC93_11850 [Morococcus cerebrosus]|uniref:Uncharacterized protein n=1 Tax=Morococcus cerebrosus TaxID=1056807 RepID=A0A0C1GQ64_9NEIS|nr:hypothetical protein MCC93_11850 [Morococcus cerebrosus]